jgi:hypothetical protein
MKVVGVKLIRDVHVCLDQGRESLAFRGSDAFFFGAR